MDNDVTCRKMGVVPGMSTPLGDSEARCVSSQNSAACVGIFSTGSTVVQATENRLQ